MKVSKLVSCLFLLTFFYVVGCGVDTTETCTTNNDCVPGYLCYKEVCEPRDPVVIVTEALSHATIDLNYDFTLVAEDGIPPYKWSLETHPDWMSIDEDTGKLSGKPLVLAEDLIVEVSIQDASIGRDSSYQKEFSIDVKLCYENQQIDCWEPNEDEYCEQGKKICSGGDFGPCSDLTPSSTRDHCGPVCSPCDQTSDRCANGKCACGSGSACDVLTCCGASCVDLDTDEKNCGQCGNDCTELLQNVVNPRCTDGQCLHDGCNVGFLDCEDPDDGCEVEQSANKCGSCDNDCTVKVENVVEVLCVDIQKDPKCGYEGDGTQGEGCTLGWLDCDADRTNGCETQVDEANCAACGQTCGSICLLDPSEDYYYCGCQSTPDCVGGDTNKVCIDTSGIPFCGCNIKGDCAPDDWCDTDYSFCKDCTDTDADHCGPNCLMCSDEVANRACIDTDPNLPDGKCGCRDTENEKTDCGPTWYWCDVADHLCKYCSVDENCGQNCADCTGNTHYKLCINEACSCNTGVGPNDPEEDGCGSAFWCNTSQECHTCDDDQHCGDSCEDCSDHQNDNDTKCLTGAITECGCTTSPQEGCNATSHCCGNSCIQADPDNCSTCGDVCTPTKGGLHCDANDKECYCTGNSECNPNSNLNSCTGSGVDARCKCGSSAPCTGTNHCCNGNCCTSGQVCCNGQCCASGQECCGAVCCSGKCCNGSCHSGSCTCCGTACCSSGQLCCFQSFCRTGDCGIPP